MKGWLIELLAISLLGFLGIYAYSYLSPTSTIPHSAYCALIMFSVFTFFIFSLMNLFQPMLTGSAVAGVMMAAILGRIVIVIVSLFWYKSTFQPQDNWYLAPFLFFYLIFLVYENYKLIQISNEVHGK